MKVKPRRFCLPPGYPEKEEFFAALDDAGYLPSRWAKNSVVMAALGMTLALSACSAPAAEDVTGAAEGETGAAETETKADGRAVFTAAVAPVFIHGEGSGGFGCVAVTSPYFFSEAEAFEIIRSEAELYGGLVFDGDEPPVLENVRIPQTSLNDSGKKLITPYVNGSLELDGADREKHIAFEFVSSSDVVEWKKENGVYSTVSTYDMQSTAKDLQKGIKHHKGELQVGIFYDPYDYAALSGQYSEIDKKHSGPDRDWAAVQEEKDEAAKAVSEENLRMQVRDFIDWLKGQGVI